MDRQDVIQVLTDAMRGTPDEEQLGGRVKAGMVKSRLLEAHPPEPSDDGVATLLGEIGNRASFGLEQLSDDLWALLGAEDALIVDTLNPRFWLLHTTSPVTRLRSLLRRYVVSTPRLDSAWFSAEHLRQMEGERRWIKSSFAADTLQPNDPGSEVPRRWRARVEGENPEEFLDFLGETRYTASASLTAVGSVIDDERLGRVEMAADYQGGFVSSGSSFEAATGVIWRSLDRYESYVKGLEDRFRLRMGATEEMGLTFDGDVAHIEFPHGVSDLDSLVANLFTCREPFRLWAVPKEVAPGHWEANAVDLHVGHTLRLEVTPRWMRVLLPERTCGNTLARLVANLQHRFDARTTVDQSLAAVA